MSESNELIIVQTLTPAVVFATPGGVDAIIDRVEKEIAAFQPDVSTPAGREAIRAFAFKIAKTKTGIEALGKELVSDEKKRIKKIDEERGRLWDKLEELQKAARKPLDEFEAKEAARVAEHEERLTLIVTGAKFDADEPPTASIEHRIKTIEAMRSDGRDWQEFAARADLAFADTLRTLNSKLTIQKQRETERAELEAFRAAEAARIKKENEDRIAKEAADAAREAAEKVAREAAAEAERVAAVERKRIQDEAAAEAKRLQDVADAKAAELVAENERAAKKAADELAASKEREATIAREAAEAKEKAAQADRDRIATEQRAKEAAEQAERDRVAAEQRATEAAAKAVRDEQARVAAQKKIDDDAAAARAADKANRDKKNAEAAKAIDVIMEGRRLKGSDIIESISLGHIPHVTISY